MRVLFSVAVILDYLWCVCVCVCVCVCEREREREREREKVIMGFWCNMIKMKQDKLVLHQQCKHPSTMKGYERM